MGATTCRTRPLVRVKNEPASLLFRLAAARQPVAKGRSANSTRSPTPLPRWFRIPTIPLTSTHTGISRHASEVAHAQGTHAGDPPARFVAARTCGTLSPEHRHPLAPAIRE